MDSIKDIFEWAWVNGLDISLRSENYEIPVFGYDKIRPREGSDFVDFNKAVVETPVLIFSRGDRHIKLSARNWRELKEIVEYRGRSIFADLHIK